MKFNFLRGKGKEQKSNSSSGHNDPSVRRPGSSDGRPLLLSSSGDDDQYKSSLTSRPLKELEEVFGKPAPCLVELEQKLSAGTFHANENIDSTTQQDLLEAHLLRRLLQLKFEKDHLKEELVRSEGKVAQYQCEYDEVSKRHKESINECYSKLEGIVSSLVGVPLSQVKPDHAEDIRAQIQDFVETFAKRFSSPDMAELRELVAAQDKSQRQVDFFKKQLVEEKEKTADYEMKLIDVTAELEACKAKLEQQSKELASSKHGTIPNKPLDPSQEDLEEILLKLDAVSTSKIPTQERIKIKEYVRGKVDALATLKSKHELRSMKGDLLNKADSDLEIELIQMQTQLAQLKTKDTAKTRKLEDEIISKTQAVRSQLIASQELEHTATEDLQRVRNELSSGSRQALYEDDEREAKEFEADVANALLDMREQLERIRSMSSFHTNHVNDAPEQLLADSREAESELRSLRTEVGRLNARKRAQTCELQNALKKNKEFYEMQLLTSKERERAHADEVRRLRQEVARMSKLGADTSLKETQTLKKDLQNKNEDSRRQSETFESGSFEVEVTTMLLEMTNQLGRLKSLNEKSSVVAQQEISSEQSKREKSCHRGTDAVLLEKERQARQEIEEMMSKELFDLRSQIETLKEKNASQLSTFQDELESTRKAFESELMESKTQERSLSTEIERLEQEIRVRDDTRAGESDPIEAKEFLIATTDTLRHLSAQMKKLKEDAAASGITPNSHKSNDRTTIEAELVASKDREEVLELELTVLKKKVNELTQRLFTEVSSDEERSEQSSRGEEEKLSSVDSASGREGLERRGSKQHSMKITQKTLQVEALQKQLTKSRKFFREQLESAKEREEKLVQQVEDLQARLDAKDGALSATSGATVLAPTSGHVIKPTVSQSTGSPSSNEGNPVSRKPNRPVSWWKSLFGGSSSQPTSSKFSRRGPKGGQRVQENEEMTFIGSR